MKGYIVELVFVNNKDLGIASLDLFIVANNLDEVANLIWNHKWRNEFSIGLQTSIFNDFYLVVDSVLETSKAKFLGIKKYEW